MAGAGGPGACQPLSRLAIPSPHWRAAPTSRQRIPAHRGALDHTGRDEEPLPAPPSHNNSYAEARARPSRIGPTSRIAFRVFPRCASGCGRVSTGTTRPVGTAGAHGCPRRSSIGATRPSQLPALPERAAINPPEDPPYDESVNFLC